MTCFSILPDPVWIGLSDNDLLTQFRWVDGSYPTWSAWAPSVARSSDDFRCVTYSDADKLWYHQSCDAVKPYVCQKDYGNTLALGKEC